MVGSNWDIAVMSFAIPSSKEALQAIYSSLCSKNHSLLLLAVISAKNLFIRFACIIYFTIILTM